MRRRWVSWFWKAERGQDLIEYTLILGFIVIVAVAIITSTSVANELNAIWSQTSNYVATAAK